MSDKIVQIKMDEHLSNTRLDIKAVLQRFEGIGVKIDRRFQRDFIKLTTDCVVETCERYCSKKRSRSSRKDKKSESSKKDDEKRRNSEERRTSKDSIIDGDSRMALEVCSPVKRAYEGEPSLNGENDKRRKTTDEIDSSVPMDLCKNETPKIDDQPDQPLLFFYCAHCLDAIESGESIGGSIDGVYKHWQSSHIINLPSKPFQFSVAQTAVCHFGDAIGTYRELLKHQQQAHLNESLAFVSYDDRRKCGICLTSFDSMVDHFEIEHTSILKADFFNPMRMPDQQLDDLLKIEVHKKRQCGHCDAIFETDNQIDIHHELGHENEEKITKPYTDNRGPFLICGYCQSNVERDKYVSHVKSHKYVFKCWKCTYQTKDLVDLVFHDSEVHERDTLNYHCSMFSDWLKSHFEKTKMVFPNGLELKTYNLFGTKFDDSKVFGVFLEGLIELVRNKFDLLNAHRVPKLEMNEPEGMKENGHVTPVPPVTPDETAFLQAELNKQNELANNLLILKMPRMTMDPAEMFLQLCQKLHLNVSMNDIQHAYRRNDDIVVCLNRYELKENIRNVASMQTIESADIFELTPEQWNKKIKIVSHTTRYYSDMLTIAREARKERIIWYYELTKKGIHIKRSATSDERIFISKTELLSFIHRLRRN